MWFGILVIALLVPTVASALALRFYPNDRVEIIRKWCIAVVTIALLYSTLLFLHHIHYRGLAFYSNIAFAAALVVVWPRRP
jgi:hypothetical protein